MTRSFSHRSTPGPILEAISIVDAAAVELLLLALDDDAAQELKCRLGDEPFPASTLWQMLDIMRRALAALERM